MKKQYLATLALTFLLFFGSIRPAEAAFVDPMQFLKEFGTDTIAWFLGGMMTGELTRTTADWVNSGFNAASRGVIIDPDTGEPEIGITLGDGDATFVANPSAFFREITAESAETFLEQLSAATAEDDPTRVLDVFFPGFTDDLLEEVASGTRGRTGNFFDNFVSDLEEEELDVYLNDFSAGGWDMFLRTTQNCANNYGCARIAVLTELDSRINQATSETQTELAQGGGFLTIRECVRPSDTEPSGCAEYRNVTPGQLIGEQITKATSVEFDRYTEMDEITQVLVTLLEQALNTIINQGLSALTEEFFEDQDFDAQYEELDEQVQEQVRAVEEQAGEIEGESPTEPVPTTGTGCAATSGGNVCTTSTDVEINAFFNGSGATQTFPVVYTGEGTFESDIEYDFGEYNDSVLVFTSAADGGGTGELEDGDLVEISVRIIDLSAIDDFDDFSGVVTIGELSVNVQGVDWRP